MNIDASKVIEKLQVIIGQQTVQIAILQAQIDELNKQIQQLQEHKQPKE